MQGAASIQQAGAAANDATIQNLPVGTTPLQRQQALQEQQQPVTQAQAQTNAEIVKTQNRIAILQRGPVPLSDLSSFYSQ
jgi:hypothetical protein